MKIRINGEIRGTPRVRLIGTDGDMLGVMTLAEALRLALKQGLDLVEVNPKADPPVCKLLDFDKYRYAAKLNAAEANRKDEDDGDEPEE
jgi:translation initiation factor IF-3